MGLPRCIVFVVVPVVVLMIAYCYTNLDASTGAYNSVLQQSIHYFSRPHEGVPLQLEPIKSNAAWKGSELQNRTELWLHTFTNSERQELIEAMNHLMTRFNVSNRFDVAKMVAEDFPLPNLGPKISSWRKELTEHGRGFQVLR